MSSKRPTKGETYAGSFVPLVAAYTAAACCCEKQRVRLTLMPCFTDICAARSPSAVHGYLTYAFGIQEYISCPWLNISCADVLSSENTSIDTPASPTSGEIVCTILLYSSISSRLESLCPDAMSSLMCGFLAIKDGLVVWPSTNPNNSLTRRVSCGSPPSTNIFVLGLVIGMLLFVRVSGRPPRLSRLLTLRGLKSPLMDIIFVCYLNRQHAPTVAVSSVRASYVKN